MTTNNAWDSRDTTMLDLFRFEVDTQVALLNDGLLALERDPHATAPLASLMRAAHAIKGAARVVQMRLAEQIAHAMEDGFVAAQAGRVHFRSAQIEVLLHSTDVLLRLAHNTTEGTAQETATAEGTRCLEALADLLPPDTSPALPGEAALVPPAQPEGDLPFPPRPVLPMQSTLAESTDTGRVLRVTTESLRQLMGLAGESVVEVRRLQPFASSLLQLKSSQIAVAEVLDKLWESLQGLNVPARTERYLRAARQQAEVCRQLLSERLTELEFFVHRAENLADRLYHAAIATHMRPFADGVQGLPRMVRDVARQMGKDVTFDIIGHSTEVDRDILERLETPLNHLLRNAIDHGIETPAERLAAGKPATGTIRLEARHQAGMFSLTVTDDGRGVDVEQVRRRIVQQHLVAAAVAAELTVSELLEFLFLPGFSTAATVTEISGRGVGLDAVQRMAREAGGTVRAVSEPGQGMSFHLQLPLTLSVLRALLVAIAGEPYAFPLARLEHACMVPLDTMEVFQNDRSFTLDDHQVELVWTHHLLELEVPQTQTADLPVLIVSDRGTRYGLVVDRFLGETDLVVQPLDARLGKIPDISAAALLEDGSPVLILDVEDMVRSAEHLLAGRHPTRGRRTAHECVSPPRQRVLVVDDSITVRERERQLLEQHGYAVDVAVDGMDGWNAIRMGHYDLVITDVDMPRLDGLELVRRIKHAPHLQGLAVIIVSYKDSEQDRRRGLEAGANAYITKGEFQEQHFVQTVRELIGESW